MNEYVVYNVAEQHKQASGGAAAAAIAAGLGIGAAGSYLLGSWDAKKDHEAGANPNQSRTPALENPIGAWGYSRTARKLKEKDELNNLKQQAAG